MSPSLLNWLGRLPHGRCQLLAYDDAESVAYFAMGQSVYMVQYGTLGRLADATIEQTEALIHTQGLRLDNNKPLQDELAEMHRRCG